MAVKMAPKPVPPWEAAKILRRLSQQLLGYFDGSGAGEDSTGYYLAHAAERFQNARTNTDAIDSEFARLESVIDTRRAAEIRQHVLKIRALIINERLYLAKGRQYLESAVKGVSSGSSPSSAMEVAKQMMDLIQSLPTDPSLPGTQAESTLRAVVATLRSAGIDGAEEINVKTIVQKGVSNGEEGNQTSGAEAEAVGAGTGG
jgi:hypothetical protein